ncbi:2-C-methyl-D-erythritol 4-phosphate cytidylyltransferase [Ectothiorhodospiraceae bacterium 2226]|nr:2-C-methyl-D-erythritol 4-phosphate cytidylyltransferase [Ectothiorhodospiraceae bacterium 2226]
MNDTPLWAVVPAAGSGARMGTSIPKQYLPLHGKTVIEHTVERLLAHPRVAGVVLALAADDGHWAALQRVFDKPVWLVAGGAERSDSVRNALMLLGEQASASSWVLVHDAARPCLRAQDIDRLIDAAADHAVGALLGVRVNDTVKRSDARGSVTATVSREGLWRALTPQMFRLGALREALEAAQRAGEPITDEAGAMERLGLQPLMVEGHADNIKITRPQDLALAALFLRQQQEQEA